MTWQIISAQSPGLRTEQQDCGNAWISHDGKSILAVLADGAGGHQGGQQASAAAVEAARILWECEPPGVNEAEAFLEKISRAAYDAVSQLARPGFSSRTTWVALLALETKAWWVHSGDSRLYHFVADLLVSRTRDHSVVELLVEQGKITEADVASHPDRARLLQSLGGKDYLPVEAASADIGESDLFLLCTDGVWSGIVDSELLAVAQAEAGQRSQVVRELVQAAVRKGGKDADNASLWCIFKSGDYG